jgi:hypothetical protein
MALQEGANRLLVLPGHSQALGFAISDGETEIAVAILAGRQGDMQ